MELEGIINEHFNELNENEKAIIEYIIKNKANCQEMTIIELAKETLTSKSSILRLTQKLGFSGYSEFKYSIRKDISKQNNVGQEYDLYSMQIKDIETTKKIFEQTELTPILKQMQEAERIFCYGTGWGQRNVLADFLRSMISVGRYPILLEAKRELEMASKSDIKSSDLLIVVSLSGDIREVEKEMGILKLKGIPIVSITSLSNNSLASLGKHNLYFQSTPVMQGDTEIVSFLPIHLTLDSLYRKYVDYRNDLPKQCKPEI